MRTLWLALAALASAEIVDRIAVAVDRLVITASAIEEQIRVAAFLNQTPTDLSPAGRRRMAERMIEQALLRREMRISRFNEPAEAEADPVLRQLRQSRAGTPEEFSQLLDRFRIGEDALRRNLLWQLAVLRFTDVRFRPGSAVSEGEIEIHYREVYVPEWRSLKGQQAPPDLEEVRDRIEETLLGLKVEQALDEWLKDARAQAKVRYFEEAFQ
jgi:hypothetical protein